MNFYKEELMDHYKNPRHYGKLENPNLVSDEHNPSCGDSIEIQGIINQNLVLKLNFIGKGCIISQAAASMLMEKCSGKSIEELGNFTNNTVLDMLGFNIGPNRAKCALLSFFALKNGLSNYLEGKLSVR